MTLRSVCVAGALMTVLPARAFAQCPESMPMGHILGTHCSSHQPPMCFDNTHLYWTGLPEEYVSGRFFVLKDPSIHSGSQEFLATKAGIPGRLDCLEAGTATDGILCVKGDWGDAGVTGCPAVPTSMFCGNTFCDTASTVIVATSIQREGDADHTGVYIIASVGYSVAEGYRLDLAHPPDYSVFPYAYPWLPIAATSLPAPQIADLVNHDDGTASITAQWTRPKTFDDCYPVHCDTCEDEFKGDGGRPVIEAFGLFALQTSCDAPPTTSQAAIWGMPVATAAGDQTALEATIPYEPGACTHVSLGMQLGGEWMPVVSAHATLNPPCASDADCAVSTCTVGTCVDATCAFQPAPRGTPCPDDNPCNGEETCAGGECIAGDSVAGCCSSDADCVGSTACHSMSCDLATHTCLESPIPGCCSGRDCNGEQSAEGGCGCSTVGRIAPPPSLLGLMLVLPWLRRRRS